MPKRGPLRLAKTCSISLADFTSITWRRKPIESSYTEGNPVLLEHADLQFPASDRRVIRDLENDPPMRFQAGAFGPAPRPIATGSRSNPDEFRFERPRGLQAQHGADEAVQRAEQLEREAQRMIRLQHETPSTLAADSLVPHYDDGQKGAFMARPRCVRTWHDAEDFLQRGRSGRKPMYFGPGFGIEEADSNGGAMTRTVICAALTGRRRLACQKAPIDRCIDVAAGQDYSNPLSGHARALLHEPGKRRGARAFRNVVCVLEIGPHRFCDIVLAQL